MADQLVAILGVSQRRAAELLREAGGEVETAVALHFSSNGAASREAAADSPRSQLRSIVGMQLSRERAAAMLARAGGDVQLAADRFFAEEVRRARNCCTWEAMSRILLPCQADHLVLVVLGSR